MLSFLHFKGIVKQQYAKNKSIVLLSRIRKLSTQTSTNEEEVDKFSKIGKKWWDVNNGQCSMLHLANPARVKYANQIFDTFCNKGLNKRDTHIIDVGCGGGLATECFARIGYKVTGIDASEENIAVAKWHAGLDPLLTTEQAPEYIATTVEKLSEERPEHYDAAVCLEVIEHVDNPQLFVNNISKLVKQNGMLIFSTMNKNVLSYISTILLAENLLGLIEKGTHDYRKYIKPSELTDLLDMSDCTTVDIVSLTYNPLSGSFYVSPPSICNEPLVNYIHTSMKNQS